MPFCEALNDCIQCVMADDVEFMLANRDTNCIGLCRPTVFRPNVFIEMTVVAQSSVAPKIIRPNVFRPTGFSPDRLHPEAGSVVVCL